MIKNGKFEMRSKEKRSHPLWLLLRKPEPEPLEPVFGDTLGPFNSIESSLSGVQIRLSRVDEVSALEQLPEEIQAEVDGDTDVVGEEALVVPAPCN